MVQSKATTVEEYLGELEPGRREVVSAVLGAIRESIPAGYEEGMLWGMVSWYIPLERYPDTYNDQPLSVVSLAAQKRHYAVYLNSIYADPSMREEFERRYRESGKRLDVGKACVRFRKLEDLPVELVGWAVGQVSVEEYIERYEAARA